MPRYLQYLFGFLIAAMLLGVPFAYAYHRAQSIRNFRMVRDGVLYRSGQMRVAGLQSVIHDYGIKTVVTLRDSHVPNEPPPDLAEEEFCKAEEINYYRISPREWWAPDGSIPAENGVKIFRAIMDDPANYPVLIHCYGGIHRTGAFCAVYRMEYQHWTNEQAIAELRACGYTELDDEWDLLTYLEQYQPRWKGGDKATTSPNAWELAKGRKPPTPRKPRKLPTF
jgi:protein tyrosine/serine phosphatase